MGRRWDAHPEQRAGGPVPAAVYRGSYPSHPDGTVQSFLAEVGIEIIIESTDDLGGMLSTQDYDIVQFGWSNSPLFVGQPAQKWLTGSGSNFGRYSNPRVDLLAHAQLEATRPGEAAEIANEVVEILFKDAYVLPMYDVPVYMFVTDDYISARDNSAGSLRALYENHTWGMVAQ